MCHRLAFVIDLGLAPASFAPFVRWIPEFDEISFFVPHATLLFRLREENEPRRSRPLSRLDRGFRSRTDYCQQDIDEMYFLLQKKKIQETIHRLEVFWRKNKIFSPLSRWAVPARSFPASCCRGCLPAERSERTGLFSPLPRSKIAKPGGP